MNSRRLALFDFCGTLANFQTADEFVRFALVHHSRGMPFAQNFSRTLLYKFRLIDSATNKTWILSWLKGMTAAQINSAAEAYVRDRITPNLNSEVIQKLKHHRDQGDLVAIVSAGYRPYLDLFAQSHQIELVLGTELEMHAGVCTGRIAANGDCLHEAKVARLRTALDLSKFDLQNSTAYSDHPSDMPLLKLVGKGVIIQTRQFPTLWKSPHSFEVIHV